MKASEQIDRAANRLFRLCVADGSLSESRIRQVVEQAIAAQHRGYLVLLSRFLRLVRLNRQAHTAAVETAVPLPPAVQAIVQDHLCDEYGPEMNVQFAEKPMLLGGMRIKVGNDVYDGSVRSKLAALEASF